MDRKVVRGTWRQDHKRYIIAYKHPGVFPYAELDDAAEAFCAMLDAVDLQPIKYAAAWEHATIEGIGTRWVSDRYTTQYALDVEGLARYVKENDL